MITKGTNFPVFRNNLVGHSLHIFLFFLETDSLGRQGWPGSDCVVQNEIKFSAFLPLPPCWDYMECTKSLLLWTVNKSSGPELQHARTSGFPQGSFYFLHIVVSLVTCQSLHMASTLPELKSVASEEMEKELYA